MSSEASGRRILADVNVWIATVLESHPHHRPVIAWWTRRVVPAGDRVLFCRLTQLGFLRLLCNVAVMGSSVRRAAGAWADYEKLLAQPPVAFLAEPDDVDSAMHELTHGVAAGSGVWTDAYLAALAIRGGLELATFDRGFKRFGGALALELIE